jgi:Carbohydrate binding module (family 35)
VAPTRAGLPLTGYEAESPENTLVGNASLAGCAACSGQQKVGNLYAGGAVTFNGIKAPRDGTYQLNVTHTTADQHSARVGANGGTTTTVNFPPSGGWGIPATVTVPVKLKAGINTITLDSGSSYSPDTDAIALPQKGSAQ